MKKNNMLKLIVLTGILFYYSCKTLKPINNSANKNSSNTVQDSSRLAFYKGDTIGYINYLYRNQTKYVGKPLSVLLHDLDCEIDKFWPRGGYRRDQKTYSIALEMKTFGQRRIIDRYGNVEDIELGVAFQSFIPRDSIKAITSANGAPNYLNWSKKAEEYFGKQIVGSLWLMNYLKR